MKQSSYLKRIILAFLIACFVPGIYAYAKTNGRTAAYYSFDTDKLRMITESRFTIGSFSGYYEYMQSGQLSYYGPSYGRAGKSTNDGAFCAEFQESESVLEHADWGNITLWENFSQPVALGEKVHFSLEFWNETSASNLVARVGVNGKFGNYAYTPLYPQKSDTVYTGDAWMIRFAEWFYFVGTYDLVGKYCTSGAWHKMDVVVDTQNEDYDGIQTIAFYLDGELRHIGAYDADATTAETELVSSLTGLRLQLSPKTQKISSTEEQYYAPAETMYVDNVMLNILGTEEAPLLPEIDGKAYTGGYYVDSMLTYSNVPGAMALSKSGDGVGAQYGLQYASDSGMLQMELAKTASPATLYLWNRETLAPLSTPIRLTEYNETPVLDEDFSDMSGSTLPDAISVLGGSAAADAVSAKSAAGIFGNQDAALYVSNTAGSASFTTQKSTEAGVKVSAENTPLSAGDSLVISFDYAQTESQFTKSVVPVTDDGEMQELVRIAPDGDVRIFGNPCWNEKSRLMLNDNQWYHFDIVLNTDIWGQINTFTAYINGRNYLENIPFTVEKDIKNSFTGITGLQFTYNLAEHTAPAATTAEFAADGFYLDNLYIRSMQGCQPDWEDVELDSTDVVFKLIFDNNSFLMEDYGQDAKTFLDTLTGTGVENVSFVDETGTEITGITGEGAGYCRVETTNGYTIYYALQPGMDEDLQANIDPTNDKNPDTTDWYAYEQPDINLIMQEDNILNLAKAETEVAGSRGFITASGENFVCKNDGSRITFWGCNVIGEGCFPTHAEAEAMADMIAANGFNLVRFHQLAGNGNTIFGGVQDASSLHAEQMDKLCYFLKQLREHGIYYYIDLGRRLYASDNLEYYPNDADLALFFDTDIQALQIEYAKMLMTYKDPYDNNGRICDNPALMGVQCVNESYIYGDELEVNETAEVADHYYDILDTLFTAWVKEKYQYDWNLNVFYNGYLHSGESVNGTVHIGKHIDRMNNTTQRNMDILEFLTELEAQYFAKIQTMFTENSIKTLMTGGTLFSMMEPEQMAANQDMNFMDMHYYWAHPVGFSLDTGVVLGTSYSKVDSMLKDANLGYIGPLTNRKPYNTPFTISEWNACASSQYMAEGPLLMAAYSKMHNWNPMQFLFAYQGIENYRNVRISDVFTMSENPIALATMPAATMVYNNVQESKTQNYVDYSGNSPYAYNKRDMWYNYDMFPNAPGTGLLCKTGVAVFESPTDNADMTEKLEAAQKSGIYTSDTGELTYNKNNYNFTVNTQKSKAVAGFFGGSTITAGDASFCFDNEFAVAYVNSVTDDAICDSKRILLTTVGKAVNSNQALSRDGLKVIQQGTAPVLVEQITGTVKIKTNQDMAVYALDSSGQRKAQLAATYADGILTIPLLVNDQSANYEIVKK